MAFVPPKGLRRAVTTKTRQQIDQLNVMQSARQIG